MHLDLTPEQAADLIEDLRIRQRSLASTAFGPRARYRLDRRENEVYARQRIALLDEVIAQIERGLPSEVAR